MLNKSDLLSGLHIPLGPALKLFNVINVLQVKVSILQEIEQESDLEVPS